MATSSGDPVNSSDEAVDETRMSECSFCGATVDIPIGAPDNWDVECEDCESNYYAGVGETATECTVRFIKALLAAGSVPVATLEPEWHNAYDCDAGLGDIHPQFVCERPYRVATPPAEPAATVHDANCEQQLGACCCHCQKRSGTPDRPRSCGCVDLGALVEALREVRSLPVCPPGLRWFAGQVVDRLEVGAVDG